MCQEPAQTPEKAARHRGRRREAEVCRLTTPCVVSSPFPLHRKGVLLGQSRWDAAGLRRSYWRLWLIHGGIEALLALSVSLQSPGLGLAAAAAALPGSCGRWAGLGGKEAGQGRQGTADQEGRAAP